VSASLATAVAVAARRALRHPVSFAACAIVIPAVTAVIALALPSYYVADASLTLRLPSLGPETVRLLRLDPFTVTEGPRYRDPLLSDQPDADQVIARLAADRLQDTSAAEVAAAPLNWRTHTRRRSCRTVRCPLPTTQGAHNGLIRC